MCVETVQRMRNRKKIESAWVCLQQKQTTEFSEESIDNYRRLKVHLICAGCQEKGFDGSDWINDTARAYQCNVCAEILGHNNFDEGLKELRKQKENGVKMTCSRCKKTHARRIYGNFLGMDTARSGNMLIRRF